MFGVLQRTSMCRRAQIAAALWFFLSASPLFAQGEYYRVHLLNGSTVPGRLGDVTKDSIALQSTPPRTFQVNEIKYLQIPAEPRDLMDARNAAVEGKWDEVLASLDKIPPPALGNDAVRQDLDYYRALASARLAALGAGDATKAGSALVAFINANRNSYHFYEANEAVGDLLVTVGRYEQAPTYYNAVASAPWPEYKIRGAVALGRALQAQGKHEEAMRQFETALAIDAKGKAAETQLLSARIGKARSLVELGRGKEGVQLLNEAIEQAAPENNTVYAFAYNALGNAQLKLNRPKEALWAFLRVDLLYNQLPDQHAEALYHLKDLWTQLGKPDRAKDAADRLKSRYPASAWNK
jgi:tetratricopeptide (TPR) repeat protein